MRGRWTLAGLAASIVLNAFLLGVLASVLGLGVHRPSERAPRAPIRAAAASLAPAYRSAFRRVLRAEGARLRPGVERARTLRRQAWTDLAAVGAVDTEAVKARLAATRALDQQARAGVEESVVDFAASLPADQRAHLAHALAAAVPAPKSPPAKARGYPAAAP